MFRACLDFYTRYSDETKLLFAIVTFYMPDRIFILTRRNDLFIKMFQSSTCFQSSIICHVTLSCQPIFNIYLLWLRDPDDRVDTVDDQVITRLISKEDNNLYCIRLLDNLSVRLIRPNWILLLLFSFFNCVFNRSYPVYLTRI